MMLQMNGDCFQYPVCIAALVLDPLYFDDIVQWMVLMTT